MLEMVQYRNAIVAVITFTLVFNRTHSHVTNLHKRGNVDVFNLLLGLYKLNPLKGSKVYKTFANNVLTRGDKVITALNFDSSEQKDVLYKPTIEQLNEIEKLIHPKNKRPLHNSLSKPEYDVESVDIEKFNVDVILNDKLADDFGKKEKLDYKAEMENFSDLLTHLSNDFNDINDDMPSTKLIPVNDSVIAKAMANTKLYPLRKSHSLRNVDEIFGGITDGTIVQIDNDIQGTPSMNDNILASNVIVL